jgi:pimeloyl-ACP methyl ester carboxylesterase
VANAGAGTEPRSGVFAAESEAGLIGRAEARDGEGICFESWGDGDVALVLVHGGMCDRSFWSRQIAAFAADYRVIALDLPGHGESGNGREIWSVELLGDDISAVVRAAGVQRSILVGHSAGAPAVVEAARRLGPAALGIVVVDFFHSPNASPPPRPPAGVDVGEAMRKGMFTPRSDPVLREKIVAAMTSAPPSTMRGLQRAIMDFDVRGGMKAVAHTPLSLLLSDLRPIDPEAIRAQHPAARICAIANVGHFPMLEAPDAFNAMLRSEAMLMTGQTRML